MPRDLRAPAVATASPQALLHRRHQRVVVRAPGRSALPISSASERRGRLATLPGLGYRLEADTLPAIGLYDLDDQEMTPISCVRVKVAPLPDITPYARLIEDTNEERAPEARDPFASDPGDMTPISCVRLKVQIPDLTEARAVILPPRSRPATLLDGIDDALARKYREEAERILQSGLFELDFSDLE